MCACVPVVLLLILVLVTPTSCRSAELYTGGQRGVLYQVRPEAYGGSEARRMARFPGEEIHTPLSGDFDPATPGEELRICTHAEPEDGPGRLRLLRWDGDVLAVREVAALEGRVRDAVPLDAELAEGGHDGGRSTLGDHGEPLRGIGPVRARRRGHAALDPATRTHGARPVGGARGG